MNTEQKKWIDEKLEEIIRITLDDDLPDSIEKLMSDYLIYFNLQELSDLEYNYISNGGLNE